MPTRSLKTNKPKRSVATLSLRTVEGKLLAALREAIGQALGHGTQANLFSASASVIPPKVPGDRWFFRWA